MDLGTRAALPEHDVGERGEPLRRQRPGGRTRREGTTDAGGTTPWEGLVKREENKKAPGKVAGAAEPNGKEPTPSWTGQNVKEFFDKGTGRQSQQAAYLTRNKSAEVWWQCAIEGGKLTHATINHDDNSKKEKKYYHLSLHEEGQELGEWEGEAE